MQQALPLPWLQQQEPVTWKQSQFAWRPKLLLTHCLPGLHHLKKLFGKFVTPLKEHLFPIISRILYFSISDSERSVWGRLSYLLEGLRVGFYCLADLRFELLSLKVTKIFKVDTPRGNTA